MNITIEWLLFIPIMLFLLWRLTKDYGEEYSAYGVFFNILWLLITLAFIGTWGGIFWW